ncbi:MAG: hypothetical protein ACK6D0_12650 [Planctomyces sp.]
MRSCCALFRNLMAVLLALGSSLAAAQTPNEPPANSAPALTPVQADPPAQPAGTLERLIYVPFRELQKVFNNPDASVVLPYSEYLQLLKQAMQTVPQTTANEDAVITSSTWSAVVEKDIVRITAELQVTVLKQEGWAALPVAFGAAAIGRVEPADGSVLLKGVAEGQYSLLLKGAGKKTVKLELLAAVQTSPENRSFALQCPPTGIAELTVSIPEPDQSVTIAPLQVLLPAEPVAGRTVVKASVGAATGFDVRWSPRAGSKPVMDLLASATAQTQARIEPGLLQLRTQLNYEILRGELRELAIAAPRDARIIDVTAAAGRIRAWTIDQSNPSQQLIRVELLAPATERFQVEVQAERTIEGEQTTLIGRLDDGSLQGVHAEGVVRESGVLTLTTDPALTAVVTAQSGLRQTAAEVAGGQQEGGANSWEYSGSRGRLTVQIRPVEPRLLAVHTLNYAFRDSELRVKSVIRYEIERAGIFQLALQVPEGLLVDSVSADGMSEYSLDRSTGRIVLSLTQKRMGSIEVTLQGHMAFDSAAENAELALPIPTPEGVERETGTLAIDAPEFLDVLTVDEKTAGLFPARDAVAEPQARMRSIGVWNFTRRPLAMSVRTAPRPSQVAGFVATTVRVEPEIVRQSAVATFDIRNAGIDTLRIAVPEAIAADVRFQALSGGHVIRQRDRATVADNGWVTWTLVLQEEATGEVQIGIDWDLPIPAAPVQPAAAQPAQAAPAASGGSSDAAANAGAASEQTITIEPARILPPFADDQAGRRRVILTQARGEMRLLRHESLSITADGQGETTEPIDVRELERLEADGYLAYRYFAQPASAVVKVRKHQLHEVAATVVSRLAVEVVTETQHLAAWRVRLRVTTSERQRLRIDLPAGSELQAPLLNGQRTTVEKATDVTTAENMTAYYVNVSRAGTSDESFLLTLQYRCRIAADKAKRPYEGQGSRQLLRLPQVGDGGGATVVQQVRLAVWAPDDVSFLGAPDLWTRDRTARTAFGDLFRNPSDTVAAAVLNDWIGDSAGSEFATQGSVTVFRSTGSELTVELLWWKRWFLLGLISGTLAVVGLLLRRTTWENRISMVLLAAFIAVVLSLRRDSGVTDAVALAVPGVCLVAVMWLLGLLLGRRPSAAGLAAAAVAVELSIPPAATAVVSGDSATENAADSPEKPAAGSDEGGAA